MPEQWENWKNLSPSSCDSCWVEFFWVIWVYVYALLRSNIFRFSPRLRGEIFVLMSLNLGFWKPMRCPGGWLDSQGLQGQGSSPSDFLTAAEMIWGWDIQERGEGIQLQEKGTSVSLTLGEISHVLCVIPGLRHSWDSLAHSWGVSWRLEQPPGWEVDPTEVSCYYTVGILEGALTMTMWQWCLSGKPSTFLAMALWWWMFVSPRNWLNVGKRHLPASCASQKTAQ